MIEATRIRSIRRVGLSRSKLSGNFRFLMLISIAHLPIGLLDYLAGPFAIVHPMAVFCVGFYWAVNKRYRIERVALVIAYIIGAEVLWRMAKVPIYWEFGKYASAVIAIVALVRRKHYKIPKLPLAYFLLLIPACLLTLSQRDLTTAQSTLSIQMSGPFFLLISCWYFSYARLDQLRLRQLLLAIIVPLLSVAFVTLFFTVTLDDIQFSGESNFATSGGFGPNQVSSMLGLGAFAAFACLLIFQNALRYRIYLMFAAVFFSAQSIMTFSRGGIYNAIGAFIVIVVLEFQRPSDAMRRLAPIVGLIILFIALLFPVMNGFTGGSLLERFQDTETTNRSEIAESDLELFLDNPLLGVGVGASYSSRARYLGHQAMSHTEFSRMLSEHGIFGVGALLLLLVMFILNFVGQKTLLGRAFVAGATVWCCLFMLNAGMRMAAPSFMWGLMFATFIDRSKFGKFPGSNGLKKTVERVS